MEFEKEYVHDIYDKIAEHFSNTRVIIWPKVNEFISSFNQNSKILDIGCGNGKNMGTREDCEYIGIDKCSGLLNHSKKQKNCKYSEGDCLNINYDNDIFDYVMSIAVIHHLSKEEDRLKSISEILRVLKKNGRALIYVWAYEQPKFKNEETQDVFVKWQLQKKFTEDNIELEYKRYYHLFKKNELEELINKTENVKIIESGNQCNNWYSIIKKI